MELGDVPRPQESLRRVDEQGVLIGAQRRVDGVTGGQRLGGGVADGQGGGRKASGPRSWRRRYLQHQPPGGERRSRSVESGGLVAHPRRLRIQGAELEVAAGGPPDRADQKALCTHVEVAGAEQPDPLAGMESDR